MKYMGSKARFSKYIVPIIQSYITDETISYIEPFVGGANIIDKIKHNSKIGGDNNEYIIELYTKLQDGYTPLDFISREDFYNIKTNKLNYPKEVVALCGVLASYNGNWFRAYGGYSKTKGGKDRNFYEEGVRNLMKQVPSILDINFRNCDYKDFSNYKNCVIYCDKPYDFGDKYLYKENQFNHSEFWDWARFMSNNNIVIISEFNAPSDFECILEIQAGKTHPNQLKTSVEKLFIIKK